ncbi:hypothetical protein HDU76_006730, partial [Blyttiomyces sp. JEL0837]
ALYRDRFTHHDWMFLNEVLIEKKEQITHFEMPWISGLIAVKERQEALRLTTGFLGNGSLLNLRLLSLQTFSRSAKFDFKLLKHLIKVDTMAIDIRETDSSLSFVDMLCVLPTSVRLLKLGTGSSY